MKIRRWLFPLIALPLLLLAEFAEAAPLRRCGGLYDINDLFWRTRHPSVAQVLARLPPGKRHTSGNMVSLNYDVGPDGQPRLKDEFRKQWRHIFGTGTTSGYGRRIRGNWNPGAESSWGNSTVINKKNLSECVVDGSVSAICLGIPGGPTPPMSLGHHTGWMIFDKDSQDPNSLASLGVGERACLSYRAMYSSNFDFDLGFETKIPGLASAPDGAYPPNDHLCEGNRRTVNKGNAFSTRVVVGGRNGSIASASAKLLGHFKDDMLDVTCTRSRIMTEMHAQDPVTNGLRRGVWYRIEHELVLNDRFDPSPGQRSGALMRIWVFDERTGERVTNFGMANTFTFEGVNYPLMPRNDPSGRIEGMFVSMQQTSPVLADRDFAIAVRDFEIFLK
ncbi:hypothetical protein [Geminicoccus roseus]|uniref:hypothetical protein n=1 Tax=Geminicoccus roseus TaxID=404900 RepID=UPI00040C0E88|nr:hypothetical protein [Geminicoccus roseus]